MPRRLLLVLALAGPLACSDDTTPPAPFAELCGQADPTRVLPLAPGRQLASDAVPLRVNDRQVFLTIQQVTLPQGYLENRRELWSSGTCGEHPRQLSDTIEWFARADRWPDVILACTDTLVTIDPADGTTTPLLTDSCGEGITEQGVLSLAGAHVPGVTLAPLALQPFPDRPGGVLPPPRELHPKLRTMVQIGNYTLVLAFLLHAYPDAVLAIDDNNTLVHIALNDGTITEEATDVLGFRASADGRYLLWMSTHPGAPASGPVFLKDRTAGTSIAIGTGPLFTNDDPFALADQGYAVLRINDSSSLAIRLADLAISDVPSDHTLLGVIDDHRWLLRDVNHGRLALYDLTTAELSAPIIYPGALVSFTPERTFYVTYERYTPFPQGSLYRVDFTAAEPRRVATRATESAQFAALTADDDPDNHVITVVDLDADYRGPLLLVDTATADERQIDDHVPLHAFHPDAGYGPGHVIYSVDDGDRSGIYVARLQAE